MGLKKHSEHTSEVLSLAFSASGQLASGSKDGKVRLWRNRDPKSECRVLPDKPFQDGTSTVYTVAFAKDSTVLASGNRNGKIHLWQVEPSSCVATLIHTLEHGGIVRSVALSPDGTKLASAGEDKFVQLWDISKEPLEKIHSWQHTSGVWSVAFSNDGKYVASVSSDTTVQLWETEAPFNNTHRFTPDIGKAVMAVAFSPVETMTLVTGGHNGVVYLWRLGESNINPSRQFLGKHDNYVSTVAFSNDGTQIVSTAWDGTIRLFNLNEGNIIESILRGHDGGVGAAHFALDDQSLISGGEDKTIRQWQVTPSNRDPIVLEDSSLTKSHSVNQSENLDMEAVRLSKRERM